MLWQGERLKYTSVKITQAHDYTSDQNKNQAMAPQKPDLQSFKSISDSINS